MVALTPRYLLYIHPGPSYTHLIYTLFFQSTTECMIPLFIYSKSFERQFKYLLMCLICLTWIWSLSRLNKCSIFLSLPIYLSIHPSIIYISIYLERIKEWMGRKIREKKKHAEIIGSKRVYANFSRAHNINRNQG